MLAARGHRHGPLADHARLWIWIWIHININVKLNVDINININMGGVQRAETVKGRTVKGESRRRRLG